MTCQTVFTSGMVLRFADMYEGISRVKALIHALRRHNGVHVLLVVWSAAKDAA